MMMEYSAFFRQNPACAAVERLWDSPIDVCGGRWYNLGRRNNGARAGIKEDKPCLRLQHMYLTGKA